nr:MAG TPA: hypothetical protein [Microviridae sp.]
MKKAKIINYLVSVTDIRCPKGEPIVFSALEMDIPDVLDQFSDCIVVVRELKQFSDLIPPKEKDETDC